MVNNPKNWYYRSKSIIAPW